MEWGITKAKKPMNPVRGDESIMKRYLLGDLAEEQCEQLEERLLTGDETFQQLLLVEDELVDDYVTGELSTSDREKFSNHFLSTSERRQKLEFASALRRYVSETIAAERLASGDKTRQPVTWMQSFLAFVRSPHSVMVGSLAAALVILVIIVVGGPWSILRIARLQDQISLIQSQQSLATQQERDLQRQLSEQLVTSNQLAQQLRRELNEGAVQLAALRSIVTKSRDLVKPNVVSIMLTPGLVRGAEDTKKLIISSNCWVQFKLNVPPNDYEKYRALLQNVEGGETLIGDNLPARPADTGRVVVLTVPSDVFLQADYRVKLTGITSGVALEEVGKYYFRVIKQ